jgi:hypothetical protein
VATTAAAVVVVAVAAAVAPRSAGGGPLAALARSLRSLGQAVLLFFSCSRLCALGWRLVSRWSAVRWLRQTRTRGGWGVAKMLFGGRQEKSKHSRPLCVSKTTLLQQHAATHARHCSSMREAAGSRRGVAVVAIADPRQVLVLLLSPLSTPYEVF